MDANTGRSLDDGYEKVTDANAPDGFIPPPLGYVTVREEVMERMVHGMNTLGIVHRWLVAQRPPHSRELIDQIAGVLGIKEEG